MHCNQVFCNNHLFILYYAEFQFQLLMYGI